MPEMTQNLLKGCKTEIKPKKGFIQVFVNMIVMDSRSFVMRKPVLGVFDQVKFKPACAATEAS